MRSGMQSWLLTYGELVWVVWNRVHSTSYVRTECTCTHIWWVVSGCQYDYICMVSRLWCKTERTSLHTYLHSTLHSIRTYRVHLYAQTFSCFWCATEWFTLAPVWTSLPLPASHVNAQVWAKTCCLYRLLMWMHRFKTTCCLCRLLMWMRRFELWHAASACFSSECAGLCYDMLPLLSSHVNAQVWAMTYCLCRLLMWMRRFELWHVQMKVQWYV